MKILPLRAMVLVELEREASRSDGLTVIRDPRRMRPARIVACGPEVRDLTTGQVVVINTAAATVIGNQFLLPEAAILATL